MDFKTKLTKSVKDNDSLLSIGIDPEDSKIPAHLNGPDKLFEFAKAIIDETADLVCAYKPNSAFYEAFGAEGLQQLKKICDYTREKYPNIPIILDFKRADIGNTNNAYAKYAFDYLEADAVTVSPYLGSETLEVFINRKDKGIVVLCRTSNPGAGELQDLVVDGKKIYQIVAEKVRDTWNVNNNCLLVVGATYPKELAEIRQIVGDEMVILVPGIGAQGGDTEQTVQAGINKDKEGIIVNSARGIIYASDGPDFAKAARKAATETKDAINAARYKN